MYAGQVNHPVIPPRPKKSEKKRCDNHMDRTLGASGNEEEEPWAGSTERSKHGLNEPLLLPKSLFFPHGISPWSAGAHEDSARGNKEGGGSACQQQVLVHPSGSRQQAGYWCVAERGGLAIWCGMVQRLDRQIEKGFRFRCLDSTTRHQNQPNLAFFFKSQEHVVTFEVLCQGGRPVFFGPGHSMLAGVLSGFCSSTWMQFPTGHCCNPIILLLPLGLAFELRNWPLAPRQNSWTTGFVLVVSLLAKCWG